MNLISLNIHYTILYYLEITVKRILQSVAVAAVPLAGVVL